MLLVSLARYQQQWSRPPGFDDDDADAYTDLRLTTSIHAHDIQDDPSRSAVLALADLLRRHRQPTSPEWMATTTREQREAEWETRNRQITALLAETQDALEEYLAAAAKEA